MYSLWYVICCVLVWRGRGGICRLVMSVGQSWKSCHVEAPRAQNPPPPHKSTHAERARPPPHPRTAPVRAPSRRRLSSHAPSSTLLLRATTGSPWPIKEHHKIPSGVPIAHSHPPAKHPDPASSWAVFILN